MRTSRRRTSRLSERTRFRRLADAAGSTFVGAGLALVLIVMGCSPACAQSASPQGPPPPKVQQLLELLQDPTVRAWIDQQQKPVIPPAAEAAAPAASEMMTERIADLKEHLASLAAAIPRLPDEFRAATARLMQELQGRSVFAVLVLIGGFLVLGAGTEWLFRMATAPLQQRIVHCRFGPCRSDCGLLGSASRSISAAL